MEHTTTSTAKSAFDKYLTPVSILLGALVIGGALYFGDGTLPGAPAAPAGQGQEALLAQLDAVAPVSAEDHIRGSADAPVIIIEYSDTECPFCKAFHSTLKQITSEYGAEVVWVYRHFPLDQLHQKARHEAVALECAAELGGNEAFWKYTDRLYEVTTSNDGLDETELPKIASFVGLNVASFTACLGSDRHDARIQANLENAVASGGGGTPWSVVIGKNGKKYPLSGAQPYAEVVKIVEQALAGR